MRVVIASGGTGGHIYPGIAIAHKLKEEVLFLGSEKGLESKIIAKEKFKLSLIKAGGIFRTLLGYVQSIGILRTFKPRVVVVMGGYVSLPVALAAATLRIPLLIHEQNYKPGLANLIAGRWARKITVSFPETRSFFRARKVVVTGNPIRESITKTSRDEAIKILNLSPHKKTLLIFGGSQGAHALNEAAVGMLLHLKGKDWQILHLTGEKDYEDVVRRTKDYPAYHVFAYLFDIAPALAASDLVVSRAGATTIAEIIARGLPSILIPYPFAQRDHQRFNAEVLKKRGAAEIIFNHELSSEKLTGIISLILEDEQKLKAMGAAAKSLGRPQAAQEVANLIHDLA